MTNLMKFVALYATVAFVAIVQVSVAQDDLDALLKDLDAESSAKPAAEAEKPAADAAASAAAKSAEGQAETAASNKTVDEVLNLLDNLAAEPAATPATAPATAPAAAPAVAEAPVAAEAPAPAEAPAAAPAVAEAPAPAEAPAAAEAPAPAAEAPAAAPAPAPVVAEKPAAPQVQGPDAELIENIRTTEKLRREALDVQAKREIEDARVAMENAEYGEAVRHYGLALKFLNDRPSSKLLRRECDQGVAEGLYRAALQEDDLGRRERAQKLMEKALDMRHPKARRILEKWNAEIGEPEEVVDASEIKHRQNDEDYKRDREQIRKHLKRSRQYLALRDMKHALEECEIVLANDPYNQDAIRIRRAIERKRKVILQQERETARDGMIADVDEAWRPVYAVNAARLNETTAETVKTQTGEDPERTMEQDIERRMKEMRLPTISFKPPATIIDAVDFFRGASKDYDRPDIPIEKRGFNFVLKTPQGAIRQQVQEEEQSDDFSGGSEAAAAPSNGLPPIPTITASDITFYEALKLVCDSVDYKFIVRGPVVMVMQKDMSTAEILSRKYNVPEAFIERVSSASEEMKTMGGFGGGAAKKEDEGEESQERDWKVFFEEMGVKWPEGSSIKHIKSLGKLYVRNTRENLAEFEKVLDELGGQPQLIEIETRFVEVSQEDLNSLGFEWILNSDYSLNLGRKLGKALGVSDSTWGSESGSRSWERRGSNSDAYTTSNGRTSDSWNKSDNLSQGGGGNSLVTESGEVVNRSSSYNGNTSEMGSRSFTDTYQRSTPYVSRNGNLIRDRGGDRNLGFNAFGGTDSQYGNGNRYLSTVGNHVSGQNGSNNDQFMRVNAFLGQADLSLILHMLSQRSDTDLLSAPKVVTKSGENAVIKVVTEYIYPQDYDVQLQSSSSGSSGGSSGSSQSAILAVVEPQNFTMREVGVILDVTPTYSEANGGTIDLELKPSVVDEPTWRNYGMRIPFTGNSSIQTFEGIAAIPTAAVQAITELGTELTKEAKQTYADAIMSGSLNAMNSTTADNSMSWYDAPMEQPFFHVRSIDSKVSITPGSTVVMGGLITEQRKAMDDKIPFLGDLPFIGRIFRSHAEQTIKRNLLIFVTGRLITPSGRELSVNEESVEAEGEVKAAPKAE